jgi:hypothetical protein
VRQAEVASLTKNGPINTRMPIHPTRNILIGDDAAAAAAAVVVVVVDCIAMTAVGR